MTPIILSADVSLAAGATGAPDLQKLVPPMSRPMLVHDISFTIKTPSATFFVGSAADYEFGSIIRARIITGRHALTDGFIPLTNFAPKYSRTYDRNNPFFNNVLPGAIVADQGEFYNHWRWILPAPLYLGAGEGITPTFTRSTIYDALLNASIPAGNFNIRVTVHGTLLYKPQNGTRLVPYVAAFTPTALLASGAYLRSQGLDLKNNLDRPVKVQRFVGHITVPSAVAGGITPSPGTAAQVEIQDTAGYDITSGAVGNRVRWNSVFPEQRKSWTFNSRLDPNEKFPVAFLSDTANSFPTVSFVGTREEEID